MLHKIKVRGQNYWMGDLSVNFLLLQGENYA